MIFKRWRELSDLLVLLGPDVAGSIASVVGCWYRQFARDAIIFDDYSACDSGSLNPLLSLPHSVGYQRDLVSLASANAFLASVGKTGCNKRIMADNGFEVGLRKDLPALPVMIHISPHKIRLPEHL